MNEPRIGTGGGQPAARRRPRSSPSAGLPADELSAEERLAELDARLVRLEGGAG